MIEVKDVVKSYGRKKVLQGVSFTAGKGEITALIGLNGSGKTTILNAIMNVTPIDRGQILIDNGKITKESYNKTTLIPDTITMPANMTIQTAMQFMKDFYSTWNEERAEELLTFFKLNKEDKIGNLSKGNKAKANMLLGLALDVDYLLMDEPFAGIDLFSREQIINVFTSHLIEDRGVIVTTHEIDEIEQLIDQAVILGDGIVQRQFSVDKMREEEGKSVVDVMREVYSK